MTIQFNVDKNTNGSEAFTTPYEEQIKSELDRFSGHITRIEVHLKDEDGPKEGFNTKRCALEARVEGRQPMVVTNVADTYDIAMSGALDKLSSALDTMMGKLSNH